MPEEIDPEPADPQSPAAVSVKWCSATVARSQTWVQDIAHGETTQEFIDRFSSEVKAELEEHTPSADCNPPYP